MAGTAVAKTEDLDGFKLRLEGGGWLMFRASGTEPVLRVYAEADTRARAEALVQWGADWVAAG